MELGETGKEGGPCSHTGLCYTRDGSTTRSGPLSTGHPTVMTDTPSTVTPVPRQPDTRITGVVHPRRTVPPFPYRNHFLPSFPSLRTLGCTPGHIDRRVYVQPCTYTYTRGPSICRDRVRDQDPRAPWGALAPTAEGLLFDPRPLL